ncbi:MAG: hypothetical protein RXQ56_07870 [Thermoproteus sp.]|jgi:hypothetical protein|uniref:hypothetical protein n=1 Tax=Thermoproteus sp. CP80 TaxID=1650659 RepID=UPI000747D09B|nr:hypothetical protein [Thermoproteus sp. CP80]KUO85174.1 MAG: hypothetical protein AT711_07130 [Thermoproteus sp. CIS_19]KUO87585.1 MAG: hypothetical protein AT715_05245 [Thermoproteus sp. JCHS_4]MCI4464626.1 hypothetical protein [Thermoproteus sp.]PLC65029.1 hypothetical protein B7L68_03855 [Thermoproteus sp. CP80]
MPRRTDKLALTITAVAAVLVALFLQGFWSIVLAPSLCGGLLWYTVLGVLTAVAVFYARDRDSAFLWAAVVVLLLIYVVVALYLTANAPTVAC